LTTTTEQYNQAFRQFLSTLNREQLQAVEHIEGPVLVLAGPGTGKTQVLAARIGNILLTTDTRPQNILCLTFTDAGVNAMRQRLLQLIGPAAHRIPIMTYHTFCNRVIQENMEYFGQSGLEILNDLEQIEIVRQLLASLPPNSPLREGYKSPYQLEPQLRNLFQLMKKERWKPGDIHKAINVWTNQLPQNPDYILKRKTEQGKKGDINQRKLEEAVKKMDKLREAADLYPTYLRALERANRYEYEDMILWTINAFEKHPDLLRNYQERYQYILVDEFQDTNGAQNQLLQFLLNYWEIPNIFIVGDDDQSIFEFQGARLQNLLDFYETHKKDLLTVVLTQNYRSLQPILDIAHRVIEANQLRAVGQFEVQLNKNLIAHRTPSEAATIQQVSYSNTLAEDTDLVAQIEQLLANGIDPESIAVLCYKHKQYKRLINLLEKKGIAYQTKRSINILEIPLIVQIREILHYLRDEMTEPFSGEHRLFQLLHAPFFQISSLDLAKLALHNQQSDKLTWREMLANSDWPAAQFLADIPSKYPKGYALNHLMETMFTQLGILNYILAQPDKAWYLQILSTWMSFIESGINRDSKFNINTLLNLLDTMETNKIPLHLQQSVRTGPGVQLLTAHAAKGLEFEYVFIPHCTKEFWEPGSSDYQHKFKLPPTLTFSGEEDEMEARRRLFYVALTRAKTHLHISYSRKDDAGKEISATRFLDETGLKTVHHSDDIPALLEAQALLLGTAAIPVITLPDAAVFERFLEKFSLSAKGLNKYLRCPLAFYYEEVLRIPSVSSEAALTGLAIHAALQHYFLEMQNDPKHEFPPAERLVFLFERDMHRNKKRFEEQRFIQRLSTGKSTLLRFATEQIAYWRKRSKVEFNIRQVELEGAVLNGAIDKIEFLDNGTIRIVDYKTGIWTSKRTARPNEENPLGGDYYRQLLFYKILLEQSFIFGEPVSIGAISWVENVKKGNFRTDEITFTPEDTSWMRQLILETWSNIQARKFDTGCGKPDCSWCKMHQDRSFFEVPEAEEVELDD
jgi:DNA helicase-2/ATP-dependent DNA helicase PcrA